MMHYTPGQVRAMSLAEAMAIIEGFTEMKKAEAGVNDDGPPTQEEVRTLFAEIEARKNGDDA